MYDYIIVSKSLNGNKFKADLIKALNPAEAKHKFLKNNNTRTIIKIFIYEGETL